MTDCKLYYILIIVLIFFIYQSNNDTVEGIINVEESEVIHKDAYIIEYRMIVLKILVLLLHLVFLLLLVIVTQKM